MPCPRPVHAQCLPYAHPVPCKSLEGSEAREGRNKRPAHNTSAHVPPLLWLYLERKEMTKSLGSFEPPLSFFGIWAWYSQPRSTTSHLDMYKLPQSAWLMKSRQSK